LLSNDIINIFRNDDVNNIVSTILQEFKSYQIASSISDQLQENEKPIQFIRNPNFIIPEEFI